jgi:amino acid adenylation domain-containing protein
MQRSLYDVLSVPEQISTVAQLTPDSVALSYGDQQLSYSELDQRAERFAAYIAQLGVGPGTTAAICMERSFDWIVAALGIMRAGGAYVPLDPAWPDSRLSFALQDSNATVFVANAALLDRLDTNICGVDPRRDAERIAAALKVTPVLVHLESLAYVIYTSGSTGTPKGVEITHANLVHLARWHRNAFNVTPADRASHLMCLGFDAAVMEIWPHVSAGATLCLAGDEVRSSPDLLQEWMIRERVTISLAPTLLGEPLITRAWPANTALRLLVIGGDVLHHGPAHQLPFDVVNNYGPTECTVAATLSVLKPGASGRPPIGYPIAGTTVYLLDESGEPVSDGQVGGIFVGGLGVGRGYRNLPDLTKRSFLPDPFSHAPAARMYRTDDRGVRRSDGEIEFCGRLDRQTKIRGFRVELDEISSTLSGYSGIEFATVVARTSEVGENHLVAYVLPGAKPPVPTAKELQGYLLGRLPDYMVPTVFMRLDALPLSSNGKIDFANLARFAGGQMVERVASRAPASSLETRLLTIVRQLLENDEVTTEDNFFLAGGHSLLGTQLLVRLRSEFGVNLSLRQLFDAPTPAHLALLIETIRRQDWLAGVWAELLGRKNFALDDDFSEHGGNARLLAALQQRIMGELGVRVTVADLSDNPTIRRQAELIQKDAKQPSALPPGVFVLHPRGTRHNIFWLHNLLPAPLARELGEDQPFFLVGSTKQDIALLGETPSMRDIAACMRRKILTVQPKGPYIVSGRCIGSVLAYEVASQLRAAGEEVSLLLMIDAPTRSYLNSSRVFINRLKHPRFYLYRAARVAGWRERLAALYRRAIQYSPHFIRSRFPAFENHVAHQMIVNAAFDFRPAQYEGKVLLLLAKERDALFDFLPGWKSVVSDLRAFYVQGRHRELITSHNVREVANLIESNLRESSAGDGSSLGGHSVESRRMNGD